MNCACGEPSVMQRGARPLCGLHYRFQQMRATAQRRGKSVPTVAELSELLPKDMRCQDCGSRMNWLVRDGRLTAITLQHYRDGTLGLVCLSCNVKHGLFPDDSYRKIAPLFKTRDGEKLCTRCLTPRAVADFHLDKRAERRLKAWCKQCSAEVSREYWKRKSA